MSETPNDLITAHIEVLYIHRALISAAYIQNGIALSDVNQKKIQGLTQRRVLSQRSEFEFHLHSALKQYLDGVVKKKQIYELGADFKSMASRIGLLVNEYKIASEEGRVQDKDDYEREYAEAVAEAADLLEEHLKKLHSIIENQFANVNTLNEKERQNAFYISRVEKIGYALELFSDDIYHTISGSAILQPLLHVYEYQIINRLDGFRSLRLDILDILKKYLYKLRIITLRAKKIRALAHYFRKNPAIEVLPIPDDINIPEHLMYRGGIDIQQHFDFSSLMVRDALADVASRLPKEQAPRHKKRVAGYLLPDCDVVRTVYIAPKPIEVAFASFLKAVEVSDKPLSALAWKRQQNPHDEAINGIHDGLWLFWIANRADVQGDKVTAYNGLYLGYQVHPSYYDVIRGNTGVQDLFAWTETFSSPPGVWRDCG